ncbi:MAG: FKBP-type peptidyl-prolyl cis-trans isomerase FkpA [Flavobacteriaceae bacterium]
MKKNLTLIVLFLIVLMSCKKEDSVELPRDIEVQAIDDDQILEDYLSTHFYNYEDFKNVSFNNAISIDTIAGENSSKIPLINQVKKNSIRVKILNGSFVNHNLYYLVAREGIGQSPSSVDSTYLTYEGSLLNGNVFDQSTSPVWFDLTQVVRGFREAMPAFKSGTYQVNDDNTVNFESFGQGAMFLPSGLGYFSSPAGSIPAYSPLIFKINLYTINESDHDGDGIPTSQEFDADGDGIADDTDEDGINDYLDTD